MAYISTAVRCTCAKWRNLTDDQRGDDRWKVAHQLFHNLKVGRPPFTLALFVERAECSEREAMSVLDHAVQLKWFRHVPPAHGQPGYYRNPTKPK